MGKIVLLDELTINQIAAGEVIERPASVVKEMVENSIDAGATNIVVEIKNGGISYIRVIDNGKGIARDDVEIAFERHATSKIRSAADLQDVKSMGFRGEALASIAAISNVELISRTEDQPTGEKVLAEGGEVKSVEEVACSVGTSITVRNLFYNTPVRYKFLKKDFTETGYIEDVITRIALVHPEISFKLINTGKTTISTNGNGDIKSVVYSVFGKEIAEEIIPIEYEYEYIKVKGVIGKPAIARSNRANQMFFVNDRYIKDKTLTAAAEQAYKGMIPIGKFAFLILNLEMTPSKVDVNVHPAKLEVRFSEDNTVFQAVFHAIKNNLLNADLISDREKNKEIKEASKDAFKIDYDSINKGGLFGNRNEANESEEEKNTVTDATIKIDNSEIVSNFGQMIQEPKIDVNVEPKTEIEEMDVFERLKKLRQQLKEDIIANPTIQMTDDYKKMEQKYNDIITATDEIKQEEQKQNKENHYEEDIQKTNMEYAETHDEPENILQEENTEKQETIEDNTSEETLEIPVLNEEAEQGENSEQNEGIIIQESLKTDNNTELKDSFEQKEDIAKVEEDKEKVEQTQEGQDIQKPETSLEEKTKTQEEKVEEVKDKILSFEAMYREIFGKEPYGGRLKPEEPKKKNEDKYKITEEELDDNVSVFENIEQYKKPIYKFIGIAFKTYIILEMNQELYIMDQHAAHERILYEKVKKNFFSDTQKESQMLLLPDVITLTNKEMGIAKDNMDLFARAGFVVEEFGDNTLKVSGVPDICIDIDTKELFMETLDEINTVARTAKQEKEEKFIATVACKAAVKANMALTEEEVTSLMNELLKLPNPFSCPHGRPTVIKMSKYDIERKFARK